MHIRKFIILALFILFALPQLVKALSFDVDISVLEKKYSKYNAVFLYKNEDLLIDLDKKDSLILRKHVHEAIVLLNENSKVGSHNYIHYTSFMKVENIKAFTYLPVNGRYKKFKVDDVKITNSQSQSVFYDDSKQIEITFPQVAKGAIMVLEYDEVYINPYFLYGMYFQTGIPVLKAEMNIKVNEKIELYTRFFNQPKKNFEEQAYTKGDYTFLSWKLSDISEGKYGVQYIGASHLSPQLKLFLGDVAYKDKTISYSDGTPAGLYKYYSGFLSKVDTQVSKAFKQTALDIVEGCNTDLEKAKVILYWVQKNIKYVAYEHGLRGFIPHSPEYVLQKRFGDCKDMTSLIVGLMNSLNLECHYSWVGTRHLAYRYEELPTVSVDNHMVACFVNDGEYIIMDGTMDQYEFGLMPHHIQGKQVLIALSEKDYKIIDIPVTAIEKSAVYDSITLYINDKTLLGTASKTFAGYNRYEMAHSLNGVVNGKLEKRLGALLNKGSNKFQLDSFNVGNIANRDKPLTIDYHFSLDDYLQSIGDELYLNLNLDKPLLNSQIDTTDFSRPIENDFMFKEQFVTELKVPKGYSVSYVPDDISMSGTDLDFRIVYTQNDSLVRQTKEIFYKFLLVEPNNFKEWDTLIYKLGKAYNQTIALKKLNL